MDKKPLLIAGAGPVGATCALLAHHLGIQARWLAPQSTAMDARLLALSPRTVHYLKRLGVWETVAKTAFSSIRRVQIHQQGRPVLTLKAENYRLPALGYALTLADLTQAYAKTLEKHGVVLEKGWKVEKFSQVTDGIDVLLRDNDGNDVWENTPLLMMASGTPNDPKPTAKKTTNLQRQDLLTTPWSWLVPQADSRGMIRYDYGLVGWMVNLENPHFAKDSAWECFESDGVIALIPGGYEFKLIVLKNIADGTVDASPPSHEQLISWLCQATGLPDQDWRFATPVQPFYPRLQCRHMPVDGRVLWLGNAAHTMSPVGGQGLNLGLHEAWLLMDTLASSYPLSTETLMRYQREIRRESLATLAASHWMTKSHQLPLPLTRLAGKLIPKFPNVSHFIGARLMFGSRAWTAGWRKF